MPNPVDVCIVGMGAVGGIMAKELASAGLKVVGLERGPLLEFENYAHKDSIRAIARRQLEERVKHDHEMTLVERLQKGRDRARTNRVEDAEAP